MPYIDQFFHVLIQSGGSDLHLAQGQPPKIRRHGEILPIREEVLTPEEIAFMLSEICSLPRCQRFEELGDLDFAYEMDEENRFRVNYLKQVNGYGAVFRLIPTKILTVEELGLPPTISRLALLKKGLVLVTGPTGSGKSTLVRTLLRRITPESGSVAIDGKDVRELDPRDIARRVAVAPQREEPTFPMRVTEYVALGRYPRLGLWRSASSPDEAAVANALQRAGGDVRRLAGGAGPGRSPGRRRGGPARAVR